jgi:hypothetical protein
LIERRPFWSRLAWLVLIWAASVAVLGIVAFVIKTWLGV